MMFFRERRRRKEEELARRREEDVERAKKDLDYAYVRGKTAFECGDDLKDNPYTPGPCERIIIRDVGEVVGLMWSWQTGFLDAALRKYDGQSR